VAAASLSLSSRKSLARDSDLKQRVVWMASVHSSYFPCYKIKTRLNVSENRILWGKNPCRKIDEKDSSFPCRKIDEKDSSFQRPRCFQWLLSTVPTLHLIPWYLSLKHFIVNTVEVALWKDLTPDPTIINYFLVIRATKDEKRANNKSTAKPADRHRVPKSTASLY